MIQDWTEQEQSVGRRLVQFWKIQQGTQSVTVRCNVYRAKQAGETTIDFVLSCIYWESKGEPYLTSVDCLCLMEFLIGVVFTDQERNRIRRNLQKFRPDTISQHWPWTAPYFRQIMRYTQPKPRNREKAIKVFRWVDLVPILDSILHRFTPSHSSVSRIVVSSHLSVAWDSQGGE
ncbi:hypothetical protein BY458DRAFT_436851 [Sporodiniella umbellata]|nr:hypothetical protein BY458DRAFT_436851 [Sporodiniella umbellata]